MKVTGPSNLQAGVPATYTVETTSIAGDPMSAPIRFAVYAPGEQQPKWRRETTGEDGRYQITLGEEPLAAHAVLKVVAEREDAESNEQDEQFEAQLQVEPVHYVTRLATDKPLYRPGETVFYRSLTLTRFGLAADDPMPIEFEILDPSGAVLPDSKLQGATDRGVGNGAFEIPGAEDFPGGEYVLVARSLDEAFGEARRPFFIRRYRVPALKKELEFTRDSYAPGDTVVADFLAERKTGGPAADARLRIIATVDGDRVFQQDNVRTDAAGTFRVQFELPPEIERGDGQLAVIVDDGAHRETMAKTIPINLGKVEVDFFPEGGDLVAGLLGRVYFVGRDPLGEPVHIEAAVVNGSGRAVAALETTHEGMGSFSFTPQKGEQYSLKITSPAGVTHQPELPKVTAGQRVVLNTGTGVFDADAPLEFNVRAAESGVPLVAAAWCRGVPVGQQSLVTEVGEDEDNGANLVSIPLTDEAGGVIRLTLFDYSESPPKPVAERLVYRRMPRRLNVRIDGQSERYAPGETVKLCLEVTDEQGQPVPAVLGVAVVDDALLSLADDDTPGMTTHFLLTTEVEDPEDLEDADFYLSDEPDAAAALDLLLGTQGWRRFTEKTLEELLEEGEDNQQLVRLAALGGPSNPPVMFDNLEAIRSEYEKNVADHRQERTETFGTLTALSFFGAVGLMLLVAMLGLLKIFSGVRFWVPAVGVGVCCVVLGVMLSAPGWDPPAGDVQVAFLPFNLPPHVDETTTDATGDELLTDEEYKLEWLAEGAEEPGEMPPGLIEAFPEDAPAEPLAEAADPMAMPKAFADDEPDGFDEFFGEKADKKRLDLAGGDFDLEDDGWLKHAELGDLAQFGRELRLRDLLGDGKPRRFLDEFAGREMLDKKEYAENLKRFRFTVREYQHQLRRMPGRPDVRSDFAETLYWHPMLIADQDGLAEVSFQLCDATTTFRLLVDAHGGGRIGSGDGEVVSRIPFSLDPKPPLEVTAGDRIDLPLAVLNDTRDELTVELALQHGDLFALQHGELAALDGDSQRTLILTGGQRHREYFTLDVIGQRGDGELTFVGIAQGTGGSLEDKIRRPLKVVPPGFPKELSYSGQIDGQQEVVVELPDYWVPGSLEVIVSAYPSALAELQKGMESMLREPNGCFEQASTSNYPNVLSLQYMQEHDVANPAVTRRAKDLLKKGYVKLTGYESPKLGYEWFGGDPGHEALSAYGLMEFRDMAEVYDVDPEMIERTARWLLDRRNEQGGFKRNPRALDSFGGAPQQITDAYITWALSESGQEGIEPQIEYVIELAGKSDDPYLIALAAASSLNGGNEDEGKKLLGKLAETQAEDGHLEGKQGSITRSGGVSLRVETTALAALAWLKTPAFTEQANRAIQWIVANRQGPGGFGSTQATILALKALVEHSKASRKTLTAGTLIIKRDDLQIGEHAFAAGQQETIVVDGLEANLESGLNRLSIDLTGENQMPYAVDVRFRTRKPQSHEDCPVRLSTKLAEKKVKANETVALTAELTNTSQEDGQPMTIAILGLPAGLEPRADQLEELKETGAFDYYETRAREVICYWRALKPKQQVSFKLDLVAAIPGKYTGPASRTYLYYTSEQKQWCDPLEVEITRD